MEDGEVITLDSAFGQTVRLTSSKWNILSTMRKNTVYQHVVLSPDEHGNRSEFVHNSTQGLVERVDGSRASFLVPGTLFLKVKVD